MISDSAEDSIEVISQACYNLPRLAESFEYSSIDIILGPTAETAFEDTTLEMVGAVRASGWMPFCYPRMDERILCKASCNITLTYSCEIIIAFTVGIRNFNISYEQFEFFVNVSTFLKSPFPYPSQTPVPWEVWGPQNTRWFQMYDGQVLRQTTLHGQRAADAVLCKVLGESGKDREKRLRVRDFNPIAVRRSAHAQMKKGWKCRAVTTPSTTFTEGFYEKNIISSLPYTEVISEETFSTHEVMIGCSKLFLPKVSELLSVFSCSSY